MSRRCGSSKPTPPPLRLNGLAMKPGKTRRKVIEGNADTVRRRTTRQNLPRTASVAGGRDEKGAMARQTTVETPPRTVSVAEGGRDEETRIEGEHRREDKGNRSPDPPAGYHRGGGARQNAKNHHKMERRHKPQSHEEGEVPRRKRIAKTKQKSRHHKEKKTKHAVLC